ncbi:acyl carrier protein [Streptomyces sp. Wh19]|uniref:acyl carrier protein n=1 Tax=Streptomyces sp. Wh19 TaxID=3076629 RepID=UPI0029588631|nr:acyl carrier protein [Streptomyces sp. Wh19]MDV9194456.1 acyl carrier protein [Streptomyces sp. Wh19]
MTEFDLPQCVRFILAELVKLTGQATPSPEDTFVDAGGDSFGAIMLTVAIEERFSVLIDILDVFQAESLTELAELVVAKQANAASPRNS